MMEDEELLNSLSEREEIDRVVADLKVWARESFSHEQLVELFALTYRKAQVYEELKRKVESIDDEIARLTAIEEAAREKAKIRAFEKVAIKALTDGFNEGVKIVANAVKTEARKRGKHAAEARHSKPGGNRSKAEEMRRLWASGKYTSRDICAEQECSAQGMSFSAARKALINTPEPS